MNELIKLNEAHINHQMVKTVNARELHGFLESKQDFSTWIKNRIREYDFAENVDYIRLHKKMEANNATMIEYHITLDMAKELAMVERNEQGKIARKYFIECEKRLNQNLDPLLMIAQMATQAYETKQLALSVANRQTELEHTFAEVKAKQEALTDCSNYFSVLAFANLHNIGLTNGKLSAISKKAGRLSKERGIAIGTISDPRWGKVKTYHKAVLAEIFEI